MFLQLASRLPSVVLHRLHYNLQPSGVFELRDSISRVSKWYGLLWDRFNIQSENTFFNKKILVIIIWVNYYNLSLGFFMVHALNY
jgi:hypothetical protein